MTKLCARGKSAAKRKFKVYPSAYAIAYASKICAGKIKDPSGTKRKDWGPKKAKVGMAVTAGSQSAMGRLEKSGMKKMMSGGFGIFSKKKEEEKKSRQEDNAKKKKKRLEELRKEIGAKKGKMMIMIAIGKPKKANKGLHAETPKTKKKKAPPAGGRERHEYLKKIQNPISEYDKKGKLKYTGANKGTIMKVANKLEKASKAHAGQARTLKSLKLSRGGGAAIRGTNFQGVF